MNPLASLLFLALCGAGVALPAPPAPPAMALRFDRLASALTLLNNHDRRIVQEAAELIREGENTGALARLSSLTETNPNNSSLRILIAYAQLQLGNLTGAFDEARKAHDAPNGNSYKCYFLAKLALLTGDKVTCRREIDHLKHAGDMQDVKQLEGQLKKAKPNG
jgi:Flp pilus assembly protein TadD